MKIKGWTVNWVESTFAFSLGVCAVCGASGHNGPQVMAVVTFEGGNEETVRCCNKKSCVSGAGKIARKQAWERSCYSAGRWVSSSLSTWVGKPVGDLIGVTVRFIGSFCGKRAIVVLTS